MFSNVLAAYPLSAKVLFYRSQERFQDIPFIWKEVWKPKKKSHVTDDKNIFTILNTNGRLFYKDKLIETKSGG